MVKLGLIASAGVAIFSLIVGGMQAAVGGAVLFIAQLAFLAIGTWQAQASFRAMVSGEGEPSFARFAFDGVVAKTIGLILSTLALFSVLLLGVMLAAYFGIIEAVPVG